MTFWSSLKWIQTDFRKVSRIVTTTSYSRQTALSELPGSSSIQSYTLLSNISVTRKFMLSLGCVTVPMKHHGIHSCTHIKGWLPAQVWPQSKCTAVFVTLSGHFDLHISTVQYIVQWFLRMLEPPNKTGTFSNLGLEKLEKSGQIPIFMVNFQLDIGKSTNIEILSSEDVFNLEAGN